jgi:hypothetical protein
MIKRYFATKDNTITNAFDAAGSRGTSANMGESDILEVFSIYGQVSGSTGYSVEESRVIIEFDISEISADTTIPSNAKYFLRLFNAEHGQTVPRGYQLEAHSVSGSWEEGLGLDMDDYLDLSYGLGSNWLNREGSTTWDTEGGDVYANTSSTQTFDTGLEDLEIDVTEQVASWLDDSRVNDGFMIKLPTSLTDGTQQRSFYTKKFFARGSQFFHKRPVLEVRWDSSIQDDRINFYASSSLVPAAENFNTLYLHNYFRGQLVDIPAVGTGEIYVDLYETLGDSAETLCIDTPATGGWLETGIYTASVCVNTTASTLYDVWHKDGIEYHTGSIEVNQYSALSSLPNNNLVVSVSNKQDRYSTDNTSRFYFYIRQKDWSPSIYTVASTIPSSEVFENLHFKITKVVTNETIFDYDTTNNSTLLSYDSRGNYFDLDIGMLEPNHTYQIELALYNVATKAYEQLSFKHKFRVVNNEY